MMEDSGSPWATPTTPQRKTPPSVWEYDFDAIRRQVEATGLSMDEAIENARRLPKLGQYFDWTYEAAKRQAISPVGAFITEQRLAWRMFNRREVAIVSVVAAAIGCAIGMLIGRRRRRA